MKNEELILEERGVYLGVYIPISFTRIQDLETFVLGQERCKQRFPVLQTWCRIGVFGCKLVVLTELGWTS